MENIKSTELYTTQDIKDLLDCFFGEIQPIKKEESDDEQEMQERLSIGRAVKDSFHDDETLAYLLRLVNIPEEEVQTIISKQHTYNELKSAFQFVVNNYKNNYATETQIKNDVINVYNKISRVPSYSGALCNL